LTKQCRDTVQLTLKTLWAVPVWGNSFRIQYYVRNHKPPTFVENMTKNFWPTFLGHVVHWSEIADFEPIFARSSQP